MHDVSQERTWETAKRLTAALCSLSVATRTFSLGRQPWQPWVGGWGWSLGVVWWVDGWDVLFVCVCGGGGGGGECV